MICRKCKANGTLTIRKEYSYCNNCFLLYIDHKFRACIGKNTKIPWNEKVLVCLSGGPSSTCMLDLVYSAISINSHKKLKIIPYVLHITGINKQEQDEIISRHIIEQCKRCNLNLYIVNINKYNTTENISDLNSTSVYSSKYEEYNLFNGSPTVNEDLLHQMKRSLYKRVAKELQCRLIFTGESTTALALKLLCNIAIGRGSQISNDIGFADVRDEEVHILRPMKDITKEELEHYISIKQLCSVAQDTNIKDLSLQSIISGFVLDLQENFPSTLTTVCKTAEKLSSNSSLKVKEKCLLCKSKIDDNGEKLTAVNATNLSKLVSSEKITDRETFLKNIHDHGYKDLCNSDSKKTGLCFSCQRNLSEIDNFKILDYVKAVQDT